MEKIKSQELRYVSISKDGIEFFTPPPPPTPPPDDELKEKKLMRLQTLQRPVLIIIAMNMGLQGCNRLKKDQLIEMIINPPSPTPPPVAPSDDELKEIKSMKLQQLRNKAKEMGLQGYTRLKKKELLELIKNPVAPRPCHTGIKRKVTMIDESGEKFTFPAITQAAKYFNINPGTLGAKLHVKSEKARNSVVINGKTYQLEIE